MAAILFFFLLATAARARGVWAFALGWFFVSALPAILFLDPAYLYGSPRLHYLPSVAVALLWGLPFLALSRLPARQTWQRGAQIALGLLLALAIALPPLAFIRCQLDFYAEASEIVAGMRRAAAEAPPDWEVIFVNVPFFFSSTAERPEGCPNPYAWTPVGAVVMPPYAQAGDFVRFNGGPERPARAVTVLEYGPGWKSVGEVMSLEALGEEVQDSAVYIFDLSTVSFFDLSAVWQREDGEGAAPLVTFGGEVDLMDTAVSQNDNQIEVTLIWRASNPPERPLTAFVHLYGEDGALIAQHDAPPAQNYIPFYLWRPEDNIIDKHPISLVAPLPPGTYTLAAGLYDPANGERLPATAVGEALPDNVYLIQRFVVP